MKIHRFKAECVYPNNSTIIQKCFERIKSFEALKRALSEHSHIWLCEKDGDVHTYHKLSVKDCEVSARSVQVLCYLFLPEHFKASANAVLMILVDPAAFGTILAS